MPPATVPCMKQRVLAAGSWTMAAHLLIQIIRLAGNLVLTRLLVPEMFGVMALAWVLLMGLALFSDIGLTQNIVQHRRGEDPRFLNTVWTVQVARGFVIAGGVLIAGTALSIATNAHWLPAGTVYADPRLHQVFFALALLPAISGFESTKLALARRQLLVGPLARLEVSSQLAGTLCTIGLAVLTRSIWALVAGAIIAALLRCWMSHAKLEGPRNHWAWDPQAVKEILGFGKWVFLSSIFGFLAVSGDRLLLGALVDPAWLGQYAIAFLLFGAIHGAVSKVISGVTFPAFSEVVRTDVRRLRSVYYRVRLPIDIGMFLLSGFLFTCGSTLVGVFYDDRYATAGLIFEILAIALAVTSYEVVDQCFVALGKPRLQFLMSLLRALALYVSVPTAYWFGGVQGALWAICLSPFARIPLSFVLMRRYGLLDIRRELLLLPAWPVGMLAGLVVVRLASNH